jgi:V8-like Glu-specific endopeptidase
MGTDPNNNNAPATSKTYPPRYVPIDILESLCGASDESQPVEKYDGSLGVTKDFVGIHQQPVGQIQWNSNLPDLYTEPGTVSGERWCSGTLISDDLFLSAGHCFDSNPDGWQVPRINGTNQPISPPEIAKNMHINFNYQSDPNGNLRKEDSYPITELLEYRLNNLDYAIVRLDGKPGQKYGHATISQIDAVIGSPICIIGHPEGWPKVIEAGHISDFRDTMTGYNDLDTRGGNSGSGILASPQGTIVGVHTNGGCGEPQGHNYGHKITALLQASSILKQIVKSI